MSRADCPRAWEVEALQDGRVSGDERLSLQRHVATCVVCAREAAAWTGVRAAMQHVPVHKTSPFDHQRRRATLLRRANELLVRPPAARRVRFALVVVPAFMVLLTLAIGRISSRRPVRDVAAPPAAVATPAFDLRPMEQASWSDRSEGPIGRVVLERGAISVHVRHLVAGQRFLLLLPDGEIEVHGTRFIVEVADRRTQRVEVTDGVVSLRLVGGVDEVLHAGRRWVLGSSSDQHEACATSAGTVALEPPASAAPSRAVDPAALDGVRAPGVDQPSPPMTERGLGTAGGRVQSKGAPSAATSESASTMIGAPIPKPHVAESSAAQAAPGPSSRFADALDALDAHAFERAEGLFTQFVRAYPGDSRAEDAWFLRAIARSRAGDRAGAAALAREYVDRFPSGLRRLEAERLIGTARTR